MLESLESILLVILPWSFVVKTTALGVMWVELRFRTRTTRPLGRRINVQFRDQFVMSILITMAMFILSRETQADEVDWPFVSLVLMGLTLFPYQVARSYFRVLRTYQRISKKKESERHGNA